MPQKSWAVGEEVLAADFNQYVQNQVVPVFTSTAQRDSQYPSPPNGAVCVTTDTYTVWFRAAGVWTRQTAGQLLGYNTSSTATAIGTAAVDLPLSVTATAMQGRRVRVAASCQFGTGAGVAAGLVTLVVQQDGVDMTNAAHVSSIVAGAANVSFDTLAFGNPSAASHTWKARAASTIAAGVYFQSGALDVLDVGPV